MHKINWWKVASIALLAGSALLGFGHDLIEDQKSEDDCATWCRKKCSVSWLKRTARTDAKKFVCI